MQELVVSLPHLSLSRTRASIQQSWPRHEMRYTLSPQPSLDEAHESAEPDDDVIVISSSSSSSNRRVIAPSPSRVDNNIDLFSLLNQHLSTRVDEFVNSVSHHVQAIVTAIDTYVASWLERELPTIVAVSLLLNCFFLLVIMSLSEEEGMLRTCAAPLFSFSPILILF